MAKWVIVAIALLFCLSPPAGAQYLPAPLFDMGGTGEVTIPADFTEQGVIVRIYVNGRGLDFMLDSGSSEMVLDQSVAQELGLAVTYERRGLYGGDAAVGEAELPAMSVGTLQARNVAIDVVGIPWTTTGERRIVGLLGGNFFGGGRVAINFHERTVQLLAPSDAPLPAPWTAIPMQVDGGVPIVHAKFNGVDGVFIVDTGAQDTMLSQRYFSRFHYTGQANILGQVEGIAGQSADYRRYTFGRFDLGSMAFADAEAAVAAGNVFKYPDYDGLLGRDLLENFDVVFDYANRTLYVKSFAP